MEAKILVVDDEVDICEPVALNLKKAGHRVETAFNGEDALELLQKQIFDLMLLDIRLPQKNGMQVLDEAHKIDPDLLVIMVTAHGTIQSAVDAMKAGAYDYLMKPFELDELRMVVSKALETQKLKREVTQFRRLKDKYPDNEIFGNHPTLLEMKRLIKLIAETPRTSVLIQGESGTGKELVANALHNWSLRKDNSLVKINCSAIPEHLLESELFGHEKGAFTDAKNLKKGMFELANGGTLFLDEISSMRLALQPKLLRVLETQHLRRIGGTADLAIDVRIIAATNQDLKDCVVNNAFREDLYYRLKVMEINIPPLRDRSDDIIPLAKLFLDRNNKEFNKSITGISSGAEQILKNNSWPGNVRELKNVIERAVILSREDIINAEHLPMELQSNKVKENTSNTPHITNTAPTPDPQSIQPINNQTEQSDITSLSLQEIEQKHILSVLKKNGGNKSKAARVLNISRSTLREKLKLYGIK